MSTKKAKEPILLSDHFTYKKLLKFTLPSIIMMVFTSIYGVVDGFFVSNFVGEEAFEAVNYIMPFLMILGAVGFMFGAGGCALVAKTLGEGDKEKASQLFSLFVYLPATIGIVLAILGVLLMRPVASILGADPATESVLIDNSVIYGSFFLIGLPFYMLQIEFQSFFVTAEKPKLGLWFTVASGLTNIVLDALFVGLFSWGLIGAAIATVVSQVVGCVGPIIYFARKNSSLLRLTKPIWDGHSLLHACANGSSELLSNISMSLVGMLYNFQLLKYAGNDGLAAYGVMMYVNFIFISTFIGYAVGSSPIIGFNFGAGNSKELKNVLKKSLVIIAILSVSMVALSECLAIPMTHLFVDEANENLMELTKNGFFIYSLCFLFAGVAIYGSSFFTALNNGPISAIISFLRTVVFQIALVLILPLIMDVNGIWWSIVIAEALSFIVTVIFMLAKRKKYKY